MNLRQQLKQKMLSEELYKQNLRQALEKNSQWKIQKISDQLSPKNMPLLGNNPFDDYNFKLPKAEKKPPIHEGNSKEANFAHQISQIRKIGTNLVPPQNPQVQNLSLEDSYNLGLNKTLAHDTKYIPLTVFDAQHHANPLSHGHENLTMSKLHNVAIRPSSSHAWDKQPDTLDLMMKAHQNLRPNSSEQSREYLNTSNLIGRKLDEATAIIQQYDGLSTTTKIVNKWQTKNVLGGDTLSLAARNVLSRGQDRNQDRNLDYGAKNTFGKDYNTLNYDPYSRNHLNSREKEFTLGREYNRNYDTEMMTHKESTKGMEGILIGKDAFSILDDEAASHISDPKELSLGLYTTSGSTFNLEKINMANEARLKKLEAMTSNPDSHLRAKGNYYNAGNSNPKLLETIKEDDDDELAKLDRLLQNYAK